MQGSLTCVLVALLSYVLVAQAAFQVSYLEKTIGYEIHWINSTIYNVAYLLTSDGASGNHKVLKSTNQGYTWTPVQLPTQTCSVSRIYQNPITPEQLIFAGDPDNKCGYASKDAGQTLTPINIPAVHHISFSTIQSGYAIGRTGESKVYYTTDAIASTWTEIVGATQADWMLGADYDAGLPASSIYLVKDNNFGHSKDFGASMVSVLGSVKGFYKTGTYVYVLSENSTLIFGMNKDHLNTAYFPFGETVPAIFTVSDDASGATWFFTDVSYYWGNVYAAGSSGGVYVSSHMHVLKRDDAFLDMHGVRGLPGVHLLNEVVNYNDYRNPLLKTYITFDNGGEWKTLTPPANSNSGDGDSLNLYFNYKQAGHSFYTSPHTMGLIIANGYVGSALSYNSPFNLKTYLSRDAGLTWERLGKTGPYVFQVGANGGVLVYADQDVAVNYIYYSLDQGITPSTLPLPLPPSTSVYISQIETSHSGNSSVFVIFAVDTNGNGFVLNADFSGAFPRTCVIGSADYEAWSPSDGAASDCWLGQKLQYTRRVRDAKCLDVHGEELVSLSTCPCDFDDYECDFGFSPSGNSCVVTGDLPPYPPAHCSGTYQETQGFRLVPGDKCSGGLDKLPKTVECPKGKKSSSAWIAVVVILVVAIALGLAAFIVYRDPALREKVMSFIRPGRAGRYSRVGGRSNSLADESDFGIHDDLLEDGSEEDAKVLHDNDISNKSEDFNLRQDD